MKQMYCILHDFQVIFQASTVTYLTIQWGRLSIAFHDCLDVSDQALATTLSLSEIVKLDSGQKDDMEPVVDKEVWGVGEAK